MKKGLIKTPEEIETIAEGGQILHKILRDTAALVAPSVSTLELNEFAEREIKKAGGRPSFKNYGGPKNPFPSGLCTSINSVVVHGIPKKKGILKEGDIIGLDVGMEYKGLYTDTAITAPVGKISAIAKRLMETTKKCLNTAIKLSKNGNKTGDIGAAIQKIAEKEGFSVVRDLVGHGVGYSVHEDPQVPCYGKKGTGTVLKTGMVIAIEPMLCLGDCSLTTEADGWTISTRDSKISAHFEHTVAVGETAGRILT